MRARASSSAGKLEEGVRSYRLQLLSREEAARFAPNVLVSLVL